MTEAPTLKDYRLLGRSGLRVSPLSLGTMTFGADWGWGAAENEARSLLDIYLDAGGNFIDTANRYTEGSSERLLGSFLKGRRDRVVVATKYSLPMDPADPNSGGNHRKSMMRSVEASLHRLETDYIDLLYLHAWDFTTSAEEVMRGLDDLIRQGKVLYAGVSDLPAWQAARMQMLAELRGWSPLVALQIEYSLIERTGERDLIPMAQELGLGVLPWSPLGSGVLTGKYSREDLGAPPQTTAAEGSRRDVALGNGSLTEKGLAIADVVRVVADELQRSPSQVAIAWTLQNSAVTSTIVGARTLDQLKDNLGALEVRFEPHQLRRLEEASAFELGFPHTFLARPMIRAIMFGEAGPPMTRPGPTGSR